jgi:hypothetical protein
VGAALGAGQGVDLVHDHELDRFEDRAGLRGQHQVERFGGGNQDIRWIPEHPSPLAGLGVAGSERDGRDMDRLAPPLGDARDPDQRRPQIALDVERQRPQRRDVQHPTAGLLRRHRREHQSVDRRKEGGECLAGTGRREDQGRTASHDLRPAGSLGLRWSDERLSQPVYDGRVKQIREWGALAGVRDGHLANPACSDLLAGRMPRPPRRCL